MNALFYLTYLTPKSENHWNEKDELHVVIIFIYACIKIISV